MSSIDSIEKIELHQFTTSVERRIQVRQNTRLVPNDTHNAGMITTRTTDNTGGNASNHVSDSSAPIQPFEWLTSPESIGGLVRTQVLLPSGNGSHAPRALHIGCGSSTVGEYLVQALRFGHVLNVDKDGETLGGMEARWNEMQRAAKQEENPQLASAMEFRCLDYTTERLPEGCADSFDLVVDKSTLDCTLCSDCAATASFLMEIYRTLRRPTCDPIGDANDDSSNGRNGGVYLVVSFHEIDLILPLVRDLPGANWTVTHTTMERQVECVATNARGYGSSSNDDETDNFGTAASAETQARKPLNVLIARRERGEPLELDFDAVVGHVQEVNDRWFRDEQPLLTEERISELGRAFGLVVEGSSNHDGHDEAGLPSSPPSEQRTTAAAMGVSRVLPLRDAYGVVFTEAEREHLTFEHFLEDWEAFRLEDASANANEPEGTMDFDLALRFLEANQ